MFNFCMSVAGAGSGEERSSCKFYALYYPLQRTRQRLEGRPHKEHGKVPAQNHLCYVFTNERFMFNEQVFFFPQQKDKQKASVLVIHWYEALLIKANSILK